MDFLGHPVSDVLTSQLVYYLIIFFFGVFLLHIATVILNFEKRGFGKAIIVLLVGSFVAILLGVIPVVGGLLGLIGFWFIIKTIYHVGWIKSILAWLMSIVVAFLVALILLFLLGLSLFLFS